MDFSREILSRTQIASICIFCLHRKLCCFASFRSLASVNFFNVESVKAHTMNSSKRQTTPWTKTRKKPGPKKKEKGEHFDESRKKELAASDKGSWFDQPSSDVSQVSRQTLKIKLTRANSWRRPRIVLGHARRLPGRLALDLVLCWSPQLVFFCAGLYFFSFCFSRRFSFNFTHYWYIAAITIWRCSTATAKISANSMGYFCCGRSRCPNLVFHWSAAWPSWHPLWWGVISFQNFMSLKLGLYFCVNFPSSSELIGYVDLTYSYEIWPKCSLVINAQKGVRLFWYSKYFSFYALSIGEDPQIFNSPSSK